MSNYRPCTASCNTEEGRYYSSMYRRVLQGFYRVGSGFPEAQDVRHADHTEIARLAVHFQSVTEKFSPHDTIFAFTAASELLDSALSAACLLHTAPASIKSSTSLRQKGLAGITEDASENQTTVSPTLGAEQEVARNSGVKDGITRLDSIQDNVPSQLAEQNPSPAPSFRTIRNTDKALPPTPDSLYEDERTKRKIDRGDFQIRSSLEGRQSSQPTRPTTREGYSAYEYKPKVKLGPRPSIDSNSGICGSDPASRAYDPRPVSTLPASVRMPARKAVTSKPVLSRRQMPPVPPQSPESKPTVALPVVSGSISIPSTSTAFPQRPTPKPIDTMSIRLPTVEPKTPTMTPEKKRLMKALELRQKQLANQKQERGLATGMPNLLGNMTVTKPVQDDDLLKSSVEAAEALENLDILETMIGDDDSGMIHIGNADHNLAKADVSPISVPETSDGPSTQASSVSEEGSPPVEREADFRTKPAFDDIGVTDGDPTSMESEKAADHLNHADTDRALKTMDHEVEPQVEPKTEQKGVPTTQRPVIDQEDPLPKPSGGENESAAPALQATYVTESSSNSSDACRSPATGQAAKTAPAVASQLDRSRIEDLSRATQQPLSESINQGADSIIPHEVPLPPIDEDEEMYLNSQRASTINNPTFQPVSPTESHNRPSPRKSNATAEEDRLIHSRTSIATRPSTADTVGDKRGVRQYRRHGLVEPVRRISSGENSDDQFLSDDSFMEELKSATVQEAKPISVSKSPITPVFPRPASEQRPDCKATRSVSTPLENSHAQTKDVSPQPSTLLSPRSVSVSKTPLTTPSNSSPPMLGKVGVSSGISQRIKALEKLQSRPTSPSTQLSTPTNVPPPLGNLGARKSSFRSRPGTSDRPTSRQALLSPSPLLSPTTSFEVTHPKPYNQFVSVKVASKPGKSRPDSISVTARIVRDERNQTPEIPRNVSEPRVMNLHHSPLELEHKSAEVKSTSSKKPSMKRHSTAPSVSSNSTDHRSEPISSPKRDSMASGLNGSRRGSDIELLRSVSEVSLSGVNGGDGVKEEKKESRKSRLLKRMSNSMAASRRSIATALSPPPVREDSIAEQHEPIQELVPAPIKIGDVNIQFPDTLVGASCQVPAPLLITQVALETPAYDHRCPRHCNVVSLQSRQQFSSGHETLLSY